MSFRPGGLQVPVELDFGEVSVGATVERLITIEALRRGNVVIHGVVSEHAELTIPDPPADLTLAPGERVSVVVRWTPTVTGPHVGSVRIESNAQNAERIVVATQGVATSAESCDDGDPCTIGQWDPQRGECRIVTDQSLPGCGVECPAGGVASEPPFAGRWFEEVWSSAPDDVWAVGADGAAVHRDTTGWTLIDTCTSATLFSVWGLSATEVWAVGQRGTVLRWDGISWSADSIPGFAATIWSIWGLSGDDLWAVGDDGVAYHRTPQGWVSTDTTITSRLYSVWGSASADVWAVGDAGVAVHWNGSAWQSEPTPVTGNLFSVRGHTGDRVWAVGQAGTVITWNGSQWTATASGTSTTLFAVWGAGADDFWVSGESGTLRHSTAGAWVDHSAASTTRIYGLWGLAADLAWAAGSLGGVREWDGTDWTVAQ